MSRPAPASPTPTCGAHPMREAVARCRVCDARLCNDCYRFRANGEPCCAACAYVFETRRGGRASLAISFFGLAAGATVFAARKYDLLADHSVVVGVAAAASVAIAAGIWASGRPGKGRPPPVVTVRDLDEEVEAAALDRAAHPYRGRAQRVLSAAAPRVSGRATALVVGGCLALSALLFPAAVKLPRWIEVEGVLCLWWLVVAATLSVLLFRGFKLRDDLVYFFPWARPAATDAATAAVGDGPKRGASTGSGCNGWGDLGGCGDAGCAGADGEAVVVLLVVALAAAALLGAAWVVSELALPVVLVVAYMVTLRALSRVANDRHGCEGSLAKAAGWGALWATIYVAPLALVTWLVHVAAR